MTASADGPIILIVDDDPDFREILSGVLRRNNFQTIEATNTEELRGFVDSSEFDCVLLDYRLDGETAFHVMDVLSGSANADAPVIMMTASQEQSVAIKAFRSGVSDFLPKTSLGFRDLGNVIRKAIEDKRRSLSEQYELERLRQERAIDIVTGTFSRKEFEKRLRAGRATAASPQLVIVASMNRFYAEALQRFGQKQADTFLRETVKRMRDCSDPEDIWGRISGGAFACLPSAISDRAKLRDRLNALTEALTFVFRVGSATMEAHPETSVLDTSDETASLSEQLDQFGEIAAQPVTQAGAEGPKSVPQEEANAEPEQVERRRERRNRVLKAAKILIGPSTIDCVVRDTSDLGMRLRLEQYAPLVSNFSIYLAETGEKRPVVLRWQRGRECGVEFV
ncbi:response regulator [Notoacmeibacter ruber]|uniref:Response regulator n=1 Tax=Notoacmeibacter ruber TaxID=2670375 RepID=A0A3L7J9S6_9HYPH|nr:response regulator [Notoacmeibacter ruber]RLQ87219.1 response regulator [Notoacmeibacter ruber]